LKNITIADLRDVIRNGKSGDGKTPGPLDTATSEHYSRLVGGFVISESSKETRDRGGALSRKLAGFQDVVHSGHNSEKIRKIVRMKGMDRQFLRDVAPKVMPRARETRGRENEYILACRKVAGGKFPHGG